MKQVINILIVLLLVSSCTQKTETPEETKARIAKESSEVRKIIEFHNANLNRWYAEGKIDSVVTVFAEDARQIPPNGPALVGRQAILENWKQAVSIGKWEFSLKTQSVVANGPVAVERGRYTLQFTPGSGAPPNFGAFTDTGNYLCYWRKENGKWFVVDDIANRDEPLLP